MKDVKNYGFIIFGSLITAIGIDIFLVPNSIAAGGASGVGTVLYTLFRVPVSITVTVINIVLFAIGYKMLSKKSIVKTITATILLAIFIELFSRVRPITNDMLLASAYGGLLTGAGTGIVIVSGASTGGSDFAAVLLHKTFSFTSVASIMLILDLSVALLSGAAFASYNIILYALLALFISAKTADFVIEGFNFSTLVFIITEKPEDIRKFLLDKLERGVTSYKAKGEYSGAEKIILMCVVTRSQFPSLKTKVKNIDDKAFIILTEARSVFGEGFNEN